MLPVFSCHLFPVLTPDNTRSYDIHVWSSVLFCDRYPPGFFVQNLQMDFFNYAGIHRHVTLYATPTSYIEDIDIMTSINGNDGK